jgi:hypothetical protein
MPNEEIITSLKNGAQQGESLQDTIQSLINSGYNPQEVQEASNYIGGVLSQLNPRQEDELITPESKSIFRNLMPQNQTSPKQLQENKNTIQQIKENNSQNYKPLNPKTPSQNNSQTQPPQSPLQPTQPQPPLQSPQQLTPRPHPATLPPNQKNIPTALKIPIKKQTHTKEIILLIILIFLVGILITTILFRNDILGFFTA